MTAPGFSATKSHSDWAEMAKAMARQDCEQLWNFARQYAADLARKREG